MRALVTRRLEGPDSLELIETPLPEPGRGQVRIKVAAAAINPIDVLVTTGDTVRLELTPPRDQYGVGWDVAGVVDAAGPGVELALGTPVIGLADNLGRPLRTHAEYVVLGLDAIAPAPEGLDLVSASTIPLNALTALRALRRFKLSPGATVLVTGAAGGVGGFAVELAKHFGLTVIATASAKDEDYVRSLGADHFIPRDADLVPAVQAIVPAGVDALVDAATVEVAAQEAVRSGGQHAHFHSGPTPHPLRGITMHQILIHADRDELTTLAELAGTGVITTRVADTYPLADAASAYKRLVEGGLRGRLVLTP
ncbi:NADP-dependent oxidoreductase [Kribbella sp. NPDC051587]|uniref:NADP-dependent oxidoreductase n=1 Tax=Kribbella sp. NPDC051587 TaxID=3364119 RepID=UPI0037BB7ACD